MYRAPTGEDRLKFVLLGEGGAEEGEHAVAGDVGEGSELEGVMAAVEREGAGMGAVAAEGVEHLVRKLGEHGGVVLAVDQEGFTAGAHAAFDVGHGADRRPIIAELVHGDVVAEAFPDMGGRHALADDVGEIGGGVEETAGADSLVMDECDVTHGGADAGAENAEARVALLFEPAEATARVLDGLAVSLKREADVGAADLVGALVAAGHAAIVIRQAHLKRGDAESGDPFAEAILAVPFGIPIGEDEDSGASCGFDGGAPGTGGGPQAGVDGVVFRPGGFDGTCEGKNIFGVEAIVGGGGDGVPIFAGADGPLGVVAKKGAGIGVAGAAADVLEAPEEGLDTAVVVGGPTAVLVTADFLFEPAHKKVGS
jgi:hypothetical protein